MKKKIILVPTLCAGLFVCVLLVNTFRFTTEQIPIEPIPPVGVDESTVAQHLSQAIRFQTISYQEPGRTTGNEFLSLHRYLAQTFPGIHATLIKEVVGDHSLLYTWRGRDENLRPIVLMAHQDIVPVELGDVSKWEQPPSKAGFRTALSEAGARWMTNRACSLSWKPSSCCWVNASSLNARSI
jgi:carboxypeptidase PM20D1